ncbi:MAG: hypothetical protein JXA21_13170 [Anaerolineae bacterium]|nr:hypothetical protein [Anaerolineae bacterium]
MTSPGWDFTQDPLPLFAGINANDGSRTELVHKILKALAEQSVVFVSISGRRGMGKSSLIDFVNYVYSTNRLPVCVVNSTLDGDDAYQEVDSILRYIYICLGGGGIYESWEKIREQVDGQIYQTVEFFVFRLLLSDGGIKSETLSLLLCRFYAIFGRSKKALIVLERDAPVCSLKDIFSDKPAGKLDIFEYTYQENKPSFLCIEETQSGESSRRVRRNRSMKVTVVKIPLLDLNIGPLRKEETTDLVTGREGKVHLVSPKSWRSESWNDLSTCGCRYGDARMLRWSGYHPVTVSMVVRRCKKCRQDGWSNCNWRELAANKTDPQLSSIRDSVQQCLKSRPDKKILREWGFITKDDHIAGVIVDIYRKAKFERFMSRLPNILRRAFITAKPDNQGVNPMLAELRKSLGCLDDTEIETLCIVHFPNVKSKFSTGMRRDQKINLLLDHCRRYRGAGKRLSEILQHLVDENVNIAVGVSRSFDNVNHGGFEMDELLALTAGLQFAYWFWNATIQPGMTRFSERIGSTLGEIGSERLMRWFGADPPRDTGGNVDESQSAQRQRVADAQQKVVDDPEWNARRFMDVTKRQLVKLLCDPSKYGMAELHRFWQDFGDPRVAFSILITKNTSGDVQCGVADELVMESIRRKTLPLLIDEMRQVRM